MTTTNLFIRCTHTGLLPDGRPNTSSVFINDLDTGLEFERRKVPCYVPVGGYIDIPVSSRSLLSFHDGTIQHFVAVGVLTANMYLQPEIYDDITRPSATLYPAGVSIWNTSDNALNWSDGAVWRNASGVIT
jgi:hypothetical protein